MSRRLLQHPAEAHVPRKHEPDQERTGLPEAQAKDILTLSRKVEQAQLASLLPAMLAYLGIYLLVWSVIFLARRQGLRDRTGLIGLLCAATGLLTGLRGNTGTDTFVYRTYYDQVVSGSEAFSYEPMFWALSTVGGRFGLNDQFLILTVAALQSWALYATARRTAERDLLFLLVFSTFHVFLAMNIIRAGLATYLAMLSVSLLYSQRFRRALLACLTAVSTHLCAIALMPFILTLRAVPVVAMAAVAGYQWLGNRLEVVVAQDQLSARPLMLGPGLLIDIVLLGISIHAERRWRDRRLPWFLGFYALFAIGGSMFWQLERLASLFLAATFVALTIRPLATRIAYNCLLLLAALGVYRSVYFVSHSDAAMAQLIKDFPGMAELYDRTAWIPFRFCWQ